MFANGVDEYALALDAATGAEVWRSRIDSKFEDNQGNGSRSTPAVDGDLGVCDERPGGCCTPCDWMTAPPSGVTISGRFFGSAMQGRGFASSPLIEGDLLILQVGGTQGRSIAAMDKLTGEVRWTAHSDEAGYSSPIAVTANGVRQIICLTAQNLLSLSPGRRRGVLAVSL